MTPRVSVLVPSYNHADFIEEAITSALRSLDIAGVAAEIRVLDDGSDDESLELLARIEDPRLEVARQENAGAHNAFNRLLSAARGEYLFLLNSDDAFAPQRVTRILERFDADPEVIAVGSWVEVIDTAGKTLGIKEAWRTLPPWPKPRRGPSLADLDDANLALLETNYLATTSNIAFRRAALGESSSSAKLTFSDLRYCHDWDFFLGLASRGTLAVLEEPLVRYRVHPSNTLKETEDEGTARMRFEIQWLLAKHARELTAQAHERGRDPRHGAESLRLRLWRSLPHFGAEKVLLQLLALRETTTFDELLGLDHPFRLQAEEALRSAE